MMSEKDVKTEHESEDASEEPKQLIKARSGFKAAITRKINNIDELMSDPKNVNAVFKAHNKMSDTWSNFEKTHRKLMDLAKEDETAITEHDRYYGNEKERMMNFDKKVSAWIETARETLEDDVNPEDSASQVSQGSERSSIMRQVYEEQAKRRAAEVRLKFLEEEEKLKEEEERIKRQRKLLTAKKEIEEAAARENSLRQAAKESKQESLVSNKSTRRKREGSAVSSSPQTAEDVVRQASAAFFLPRQDVPVFTGDPLDYNNFVLAFKTLIKIGRAHV